VTSLTSIVNARRLDRVLPWIGAAVLAAGVATFLVVYLGRNDNSSTSTPAQSQSAVAPVPAKRQPVPLPAAARQTAKLFFQTAVSRKDLARAYDLATPNLRQGMSRKQWITGNIPVQYYPVTAHTLNKARYAVDYSYAKDVQIEVLVLAPKGSKQVPANFIVGLVKRGGEWKVDYFGPKTTVGVPDAGS
jgi:hypothetical protein